MVVVTGEGPDAGDEGGGVDEACEVDVDVSVVRKRVDATKEDRRSSRLGVAVAARIGN